MIDGILASASIDDIDLYSSDNYRPDSRAIKNLRDPYDRLNSKDDLVS